MVINTDERNRDKILDDLVKVSEKRDMEVRRAIKDKIRNEA
jgi:hypothetical protein